MGRPLSVDLRDRVVVATGASCRQAAKTFSVSAARWSKCARDTGSSAPHKCGKPPGLVVLPERDWLLARVSAAPDLTIRALRAELEAERGLRVGYGAVWRWLAREGFSFKKSLHAAEQHRPDVARKRERWRCHQGRIDPTRLVFVDETWAKTNMTRTHGHAPRGQRLVAHVPQGHWTTMTFLAALRHDRIDAPCVIDGPINGVLFLAWVQQFLLPTLRRAAARRTSPSRSPSRRCRPAAASTSPRWPNSLARSPRPSARARSANASGSSAGRSCWSSTRSATCPSSPAAGTCSFSWSTPATSAAR